MKKTVGSYDPLEGHIVNPIRNMKRNDAADAFSTLIHEVQHLHFNLFSVVGRIIELLRTELRCTPENDKKHHEAVKGIMYILCEELNGLQEIYANSMEILWIEEQQGAEYAALVYERKVKKYQEYSKNFEKLTGSCKSIEEKRNVIHKLCIKTAEPDITASRLVELMRDRKKLEEYFAAEGNLEKRLRCMMKDYQDGQMIQNNKNTVNLLEAVHLMIAQEILVYSIGLIELSAEIVDSRSNDELTDFMTEHYQDFLLQKTEVFNFEFVNRITAAEHSRWKEEYCCILKKHSRLLYPRDNFMVLGYSEKKEYIAQELSQKDMTEVIKGAKAVLIDYSEFNIRRNRPEYFTVEHCPLFVLITSYQQCEMWLERILDEDLYFVDLFEEEQNFYTLFLFRRRTQPNTIFVYPALKYLAGKLIQRFELKDVMYSTDQEALKILAGFEGEMEMLKAVIWLFSFTSGVKWDGSEMQAASSLLSMGFVRSLADSALQLHGAEYWKYRSALPTYNTPSDGLYMLMEFLEGKNTGRICSQEHEGCSYALVFKDRAEALNYKRNNKIYSKFEVMGVDQYYWNMVSYYLKKGINKMCLYLSEEKGVLLDLDAYQRVLALTR